MKKKFVFGVAAVTAACFLASGCSVFMHHHTYDNDYSYDETYHWYAATCGHDEVKRKEEHFFEDDVCVYCYYERDHVHLFDEENWDYDFTSHWHPQICGHFEQRLGIANHNIVNGACECGFAFTQGLAYEEYEDGYMVTGAGDADDEAEIIIPTEYNGKPVLKIDAYAFERSRVTRIILPESITKLAQKAFANIVNVNEIILPKSLGFIDAQVFSSSSNLKVVTINNPETELIGMWAFSGCSDLVIINFNGTKEQWEAVQKLPEWDSDTGNYTVYCTDGQIAKQV